MVSLSATLDLNSGVHTIFESTVTGEVVDAVNNRSKVTTYWGAKRGSSTAHYASPGVTCQPTVNGVGTLGGTGYTLSPAGTTGTYFWQYWQDNYIGHDASGQYTTALSLYAAIPSYGSGTVGGTGSGVLTPIAPGSPSTPVLSNIQATSMHVAWSRNTGYSTPSSYRVDYSSDPSFASYSSQTTSSTSIDLTGLTPGTTYYVRVVAINGSGSAASGSSSGQTVGGFHMKVSGVWKIVVPYMRISGVWKQVVPYIKVSGSWKIGG